MALNSMGFGIRLHATGAGQVAGEFAKVGSSANSAGNAMNGLAGKAHATGGKMGGLGQAVNSTGGMMGGFAGSILKAAGPVMALVALAAGVVDAVMAFAKFDAAMADLNAAAGAWNIGPVTKSFAESTAEMELMRAKAVELGATTKFTAEDVAAGMKYLAMAGFNVTQTLASIAPTLALAAATGEELADTANIMSNVMQGMGIRAEESARAANVLAFAAANSNTDLRQLGDAMKYGAPIAKAFGASLEETAALMGKLSDAGIQGSMAGTSLRNVMTRLAAPVGEVQATLDQLGMKITDSGGKMRNIIDILEEMKVKTNSLSDAEKMRVTRVLAGEAGMAGLLVMLDKAAVGADGTQSAIRKLTFQMEHANTNMWAVAKGIREDNALMSEMKTVVTQVANSQGVMEEKMIGATMATSALAGAFARTFEPGKDLIANLEQMGIKMTDNQGKLLKQGEIWKNLGDQWSSMDASQKQVVAGMLATEKEAPALTGVLDKMSQQVKDGKMSMEEFGKKLGDIAEKSGGAAQAMADMQLDNLAGEWELVTGAIDGFKIALVEGSGFVDILRWGMEKLTSVFDKMTGFMRKLSDDFKLWKETSSDFEKMKANADAFFDSVISIFEPIGTLLFALFKTFGTVFGGIGPAVTGAFKLIGKIVGRVVGFIVEGLEMIGKIVGPVVTKIADALGKIFTKLEPAIMKIFDALGGIWTVLEGPLNTIMGVVDVIISAVMEIIDAVIPIIDEIALMIQEALKAIQPVIDFVTTYIVNNIQRAVVFLKGVIVGVLEGLRPVMNTVSQIFEKIGEVFTRIGNAFGFVNTAGANSISLFERLGQVVGFVAELIGYLFANTIATVWNSFVTLAMGLATIWNLIVSIVATAAQFIYDAIFNAIQFIIQRFVGFYNFFAEVWNSLLQNIIGPFIQAFQGGFSSIGEFIQTLFQGVINFFADIWNAAYKNIVAPFVNYFIEGFNAIGRAVGNIFIGVGQFIEDALNTLLSMLDDVIGGVIGVVNAVGGALGIGTIDFKTVGDVSFGLEGMKAPTALDKLTGEELMIQTAPIELSQPAQEAVDGLKLSTLDVSNVLGERQDIAGAIKDTMSVDWIAGLERYKLDGVSMEEVPKKTEEEKKEEEKKAATPPVGPGGLPPDNLSNLEKEIKDQGKAAGKGTRISNPEDIKQETKTDIVFNQTIDGQKKRKQYVLDESIRTYAVVLG